MRIVRFDDEFGYFHCWDLGSKDGWWAIVENNEGRMITMPFKKVQFIHKPPAAANSTYDPIQGDERLMP